MIPLGVEEDDVAVEAGLGGGAEKEEDEDADVGDD